MPLLQSLKQYSGNESIRGAAQSQRGRDGLSMWRGARVEDEDGAVRQEESKKRCRGVV